MVDEREVLDGDDILFVLAITICPLTANWGYRWNFNDKPCLERSIIRD